MEQRECGRMLVWRWGGVLDVLGVLTGSWCILARSARRERLRELERM